MKVKESWERQRRTALRLGTQNEDKTPKSQKTFFPLPASRLDIDHRDLREPFTMSDVEQAWLHVFEWTRGWLSPVPRDADLGRRGERWAARHLRRLGYVIVEHQARDRFGEADLVAWWRRTLVFVEVKTRSDSRHGTPEIAVDRDKRRRLVDFANRYLDRHDLRQVQVRFDVMAIVWPPQRRHPTFRHHIGAFTAPTIIGTQKVDE